MLTTAHPPLGEILVLLTALLWAGSSIIYSRVGKFIPPLELNFLKGIGALVLVAITLLALGEATSVLTPTALALLLASGMLGIGLGDTAYMEALRTIGARQASLIKTLAPPTAGLLGWLFMGERLSVSAWGGIALIAAGVAWVISEHSSAAEQETLPRALRLRGILAGVIAALTEAGGVVLSRAALTLTPVTPLWGTGLRLAAGTAVAGGLLILRRQPIGNWLRLPQAPRLGGLAFAAFFFGTFIGIWLQHAALRTVQAGVAQTLVATSPLFVLPMAGLMGEKISPRAVFGALLALGGVALLFV
ncbi:DMT family transporter [Longilinea arvoryzae]|nr:DMT family transporter [Longilinea arvoryzae]